MEMSCVPILLSDRNELRPHFGGFGAFSVFDVVGREGIGVIRVDGMRGWECGVGQLGLSDLAAAHIISRTSWLTLTKIFSALNPN
jgi:hypothetical protein